MVFPQSHRANMGYLIQVSDRITYVLIRPAYRVTKSDPVLALNGES